MNFSHVLLLFLIDIRYLYFVLLHFRAAIKKAPNLLIRKPNYSINSTKYFLRQDVVMIFKFSISRMRANRSIIAQIKIKIGLLTFK